MFEVGFTELLVIFVLALVVLGPEKLPRLAAQVGRWIGRARAMARQFREQLEEEVNVADLNKWQQSSSSASSSTPSGSTSQGYASPAGQPPPATSETPVSAGTPESSNPPPYSAGSEGIHNSGPAPEPEAAVYEPPAYASASNGAAQAVESPPSENHPHQPAPDDIAERPARPGDVITQTHERGT
jgi:sec-independent protein translocase protein TatB